MSANTLYIPKDNFADWVISDTWVTQSDGTAINVPEGEEPDEFLARLKEQRYHAGMMTEEEVKAYNERQEYPIPSDGLCRLDDVLIMRCLSVNPECDT